MSVRRAAILTKEEIARAVTRISHEILEKNKGSRELAIVGIRNRGYFLAERIAASIARIDGARLPVGALDITLYRDDLSVASEQPIIHKTDIDFDIEEKNVILVDDVLYTGRTIRCALDALIDFGRPRTIQLAVLIDRGHRELPIRADYVGKNLPTSQKELVQVKLEESDGEDSVFIEGLNE
ncbi:MAG: bifunctional pyr operon transcriptional regulator/uracil phosphoribosyltransferase PyrR [Candidatus Omnitrophica bacterium]|nr:bifunctional pyr operon transcriptional regulator/uracil phosphoribosyltransferase PyrR [Candidatus Omnitrophota bacterium]MBU1932571.1 bifunctional pyr operon transcriptional regulator/uracil phosphoribosyltransferase PyrR [Candidatus Omnitrophota bacterium]